MPPETIYFDYTRHHGHLAFYDPVLHGADLHIGINSVVTRFGIDRILIDLAQTGCDGSHEWFAEAFRYFDFGKLFTDQLARQIVTQIGRASCRERVCQYV